MEIRIEGVNKDYYSEGKKITALADVNLTIPGNRIFTLLGPSGCGKTTLSRALIDSLSDRIHPVLIINPRLSPVQLLSLVALRLGMDDETKFKQGMLEAINGKLYELDVSAGKITRRDVFHSGAPRPSEASRSE